MILRAGAFITKVAAFATRRPLLDAPAPRKARVGSEPEGSRAATEGLGLLSAGLPLETAIFAVRRPPEGAVARDVRRQRSVALAMARLLPPFDQLIPPIDGREATLAEGPVGAMLAEGHRRPHAVAAAPLCAKILMKGLRPMRYLVAILARRRRAQPTRADVLGDALPMGAIAAAGSFGPSFRHVPAR